MPTSWRRPVLALAAVGTLAFVLAGLSIADMYVPRPFDGVVLEADAPGRLTVRAVVPGSGAAVAGIHRGDRILGVDREVLRSPSQAARLLNRHRIGDVVPYLVDGAEGLREVQVRLGRRRIGGSAYLFVAVLGFLFLGVGAFVLARQPRLPAARAFFLMSVLFMLFLVCRLRPASYSWVDAFVLTTGTVALLLLPATFLYFFLLFPSPIWEWRRDPLARAAGWLAHRGALVPLLYALPPAVYAATVVLARRGRIPLRLVSGAPTPNWWAMAGYMVLGLGALAAAAFRHPEPAERRGARIVFLGTVLGVVPFLVAAVAAPAVLRTERFLYLGTLPLVLVPVTFAYAIVRFHLLRIRVILRRSLLYSATTILISVLYAAGIVGFSSYFSGTAFAASPWFPIVYALVIVLLFEPLRNLLRGPLERFFFRERAELERTLSELGETFAAATDLQAVVRSLVERLPEQLRVTFAALYLPDGERLARAAGPARLPDAIRLPATLEEHLTRRGRVVEIAQLRPLRVLSREVDAAVAPLESAGVRVMALLASSRRVAGLALLGGRTREAPFEPDELRLLHNLFGQAAMGLETAILLEERMRRVELERELANAASIQAQLLPRAVTLGPGWSVAAACRPAREVGGDFFAELPCEREGCRALVWGDVSGKSVPGSLMMMAAHEVLHTLALVRPEPERLLDLANRRLYGLARRQFVALGYLAPGAGDGRLRYTLAGQPPLLVRRRDGTVEALPMPPHRVPLGAMRSGAYRVLETAVAPGEVVVAYSDGLVEARSPAGEELGWERLEEAIRTGPGSPDGMVAHLLATLERFAGGTAPYDDVTVVAVSREEENP